MQRQARALEAGQLAGIGPYFALCTGQPRAAAGWRPVAGIAGCTEPAGQRLGRLIDDTAARLGTAHRWIAASVLYQGWAARLTSIYAGSVIQAGAVPDLGMTRLHYRLPASGPVELLASPLTVVGIGEGWRRLLDDHLDPLAAAIRQQVRIGQHLLRGNLASAMAGSLATMARTGYARLDVLITQPWAQPAELARCGLWWPAPGGLRSHGDRHGDAGQASDPSAGEALTQLGGLVINGTATTEYG